MRIDLEMLHSSLLGFLDASEAELEARVRALPLNMDRQEEFEVIGGLLARQCTLARELIANIDLWNHAFGSVIIRTMTEVYINLAWILQEPKTRCNEFVLYGLGQAKLDLEHYRNRVESSEADPQTAQDETQWLNSQRLEIFTEVNVRSWSGKSMTQMAKEAGCSSWALQFSLYSSYVHSDWFQLTNHQTKEEVDDNGMNSIFPTIKTDSPNPDFVLLVSDLLARTFALFDRETKVLLPSDLVSARNHLLNTVSSWLLKDKNDETN